jgi:hypothetical protein
LGKFSVKNNIQAVYFTVTAQGSATEVFETRSGLKQGDGLASVLFNLVLD